MLQIFLPPLFIPQPMSKTCLPFDWSKCAFTVVFAPILVLRAVEMLHAWDFDPAAISFRCFWAMMGSTCWSTTFTHD